MPNIKTSYPIAQRLFAMPNIKIKKNQNRVKSSSPKEIFSLSHTTWKNQRKNPKIQITHLSQSK